LPALLTYRALPSSELGVRKSHAPEPELAPLQESLELTQAPFALA